MVRLGVSAPVFRPNRISWVTMLLESDARLGTAVARALTAQEQPSTDSQVHYPEEDRCPRVSANAAFKHGVRRVERIIVNLNSRACGVALSATLRVLIREAAAGVANAKLMPY